MSILTKFFLKSRRYFCVPRRRRFPARIANAAEFLEARLPLTLIAGFEDVGLSLTAEGEFHGPVANGTRETGPFGDTVITGLIQSGGLTFNNTFSLDYGSWSGFAYSNITDKTTPGFQNQFSAFPGKGAGASTTYGIAFAGDPIAPTISLAGTTNGAKFQSIAVSNTTYTALSMLNGDSFSKKFGGETGNDPDFLLLTIEGRNATGSSVGTVDFYLADYRFADNSRDYVVGGWATIDVSGLTGATRLEFSLSSSDVGAFGMNTPAYFAIDQITLDTPSTPPGVQLVNRVSVLNEGPLTTAKRVADIVVSDDGVGTTLVSLAGRDADLFRISGGQLQLRSGITLDFETRPILEVTVQVDDPAVGGFPDGASSMTLTINNIDDEDDLVLIDGSDRSRLAINNGIAFAETAGPNWAGTGASRFLSGDFNGDGRKDLLGITPQGQLFVSRGTVSGFLTPQVWGSWTATQFAHDLNVGDFNGDGRDDLIARGTDGRWRIQRSNGAAFQRIDGPRWSVTGYVDGEAVVGDFDGDGRDDAALRLSTGEWYVGFGTPTGLQTLYAGRWNEAAYSWRDLRVGDFNGDGRDDISARNQLGGVFVLEMIAGRTFSQRFTTRWNRDLDWRDIIVADFNGDGVDDLAAWESRGIWWLTPGSTEQSSVQALGRWSGTISWKVATGDFNGDHAVDLVGLDQSTGNWWVLFNLNGKLLPTRSWGRITGNANQSQLLANLEK